MTNSANNRNTYFAVFLTAFLSLAAEIVLSRLFSVITYYYLAFFALSLAMLGMTAGAVTVFIRQQWFREEKMRVSLGRSALLFSLSLPLAAIAVCVLPMGTEYSVKKILLLGTVTFFCALPFYFSGIIITAALTRMKLPVNRLYAADLAGAAAGCVFVLAGFAWLDGPGLLFFLGIPAAFIALLFSPRKQTISRVAFALAFLFTALLGVHLFSSYSLRPALVKGRKESAGDFVYEKWNSHSRVVVEKQKTERPQLWGGSPKLDSHFVTEQYKMSIDGDAGTVMRRFSSPGDIEHLKYDLPNFAYHLRPGGKACIIGTGGGKDVQAAVLFQQQNITAIDVNPVFIDVLKHRFRDFAGLGNRPEIKLVTDEARSYISRSSETYSMIQMSLIDTWAATGAGAFSLSENSLYTTEAWQVFLHHLDSNGILTVSRWYNPNNLGETGRLVSLATASLLDAGIQEPQQHIAMLTMDNLATILVSKNSFTDKDIQAIRATADSLQFRILIDPETGSKDDLLNDIVRSENRMALQQHIKNHPLNLSPPSDDNPYFFNMLRLRHLGFAANSNGTGVMEGNLQATKMLLLLIGCLVVFTILTIFIPLWISGRKEIRFTNPSFLAAAAYFSFIGAGFILLELALVQKLTVFLGRPVYALGIILFSIILSTGAGSFASAKLLDRIGSKQNWLLPLLTVGFILLYRFLTPELMQSMVAASLAVKILTSVLLIFPLGMLLGLFFPLGMKLAQPKLQSYTPWFWALNGICSVLFSSLAVLVSIYAGISYNFYVAGLFYLLLIPLMRRLKV